MARLSHVQDVVVDVWVLRGRLAVAHRTDLLDGVERGRAARLPEPAASRFALGRTLLRSALAQRLGCPPQDVRLRVTCPSCGGPHGPVTVTGPAPPATAGTDARAVAGASPGASSRAGGGPHVSLTRSGPVLAVALCDDAPVGIDVEAIAAVGASPLADVALSPAERAGHRRWPGALATRRLARAWVRKEAALKAVGTGLSVAPETVELHRPPHGSRGVDAVAGTTVAVADLRLGRGSAGAVAVVAPGLVAPVAPDLHRLGPATERRALVVRRYDGARLLAGWRS